MAVTSHVYPKAVQALVEGTMKLNSDTFKMGLCTSAAATWGATQEAYQYVTDITGAYTEVSSGGYARQTLAGLSVTVSGAKVIFTCTSPISFGSSITLSALSAFVCDTSVGSGDSSYPVLCIIDFGQTVSSTSSTWQYTVDGTNGLAYFTSS